MRALVVTALSVVCAVAQTAPSKPPVRRTGGVRTGAARTAGRKAPMLNPALYKAKAPDTYKAKFTTGKGDFIVEVTRDWAPIGADRFYNLIKGGFYDGAPIFRVLPGFVAQFGISPNPAVNKGWQHANIKDDPVKQSNKKGTLTFATAGPNTRTTQIFINLADNARLDEMGFAPFGAVVEGMPVVEQFYSGYGEGAPMGAGPSQDKLASDGKAYFEKDFPKLDVITAAVIVGAAAPAGPAVHRPAPAHPRPGTVAPPAKKAAPQQ